MEILKNFKLSEYLRFISGVRATANNLHFHKSFKLLNSNRCEREVGAISNNVNSAICCPYLNKVFIKSCQNSIS